jgi:hypothetical protein
MELRAKYSGEASCHRNMLQRAGEHVHKDFREFPDFLRLVGPKPTANSTLDRIDNSDPEYAPGKVRWADKRTQNSNKGDSLTFYSRHTNETYTTSRLAKIQRVSQAAIRKRHARGWSDEEIIEGKQYRRFPQAANQPVGHLPNCPALLAHAERPLTEREVHSLTEGQVDDVIKHSKQARAHRGGRQLSEYEVRILHEHKGKLTEFAEARAAGHFEPLPAHYADLNELLETDEFTYEMSVRHLRKWWPENRPYTRYSNCDPIHQKIIAEIDPDFVKEALERDAARCELQSKL